MRDELDLFLETSPTSMEILNFFSKLIKTGEISSCSDNTKILCGTVVMAGLIGTDGIIYVIEDKEDNTLMFGKG